MYPKLPRKEKKYAKQHSGSYQYSLCLYCRHEITAGETTVFQPHGKIKNYTYRSPA